MKSEIYKVYRFNFWVNILDGGFFGSALGFASFITILPLFVSTLTDSAILIGMIPAIHAVGWQLPQLFTSNRVARLARYKPMVMWMTIHERLPYIGLTLVALAIPSISIRAALIFTYLLLIWQGFGGGFTATAWQSMIGKIIPEERRGTFFGFQSAAASLLASGSAISAGLILERVEPPYNYAFCFLFASIAMFISFIFLGLTKEQATPAPEATAVEQPLWLKIKAILRKDHNLRWFLVVRMLSQLATMAFAFYTVYAVRSLDMTEGIAGLMMGVFTFGQIIANPLMGWIGDRWSHAAVMKVGLLAAAASAFLAWFAPALGWFYLVFILAGVANVAIWTIGMAMTLEFGGESEKPVYIGMANTLIAPVTILAPILGGWLADTSGYQTTFFVSGVCGVATSIILHFMMKDPRKLRGQEAKPFLGD
jgi:MFS family permease